MSEMFTLSDTLSPHGGRFHVLLKDDAFWEVREREIQERRRQREESEALQAAQRRSRRLAEIPDIYRENFEEERCSLPAGLVDRVMAWRPEQSNGHGIGLVGSTGLGKTRLLVSLLISLPDRCSWLYLPAMRLSTAVADQWDDESRIVHRARRLLEDARKVKVLLLDDLGDEKGTDAVGAELKDLIEHRTSRRLPILWTSQLNAAQLEAKHGERGKAIVRRLAEFSWMA